MPVPASKSYFQSSTYSSPCSFIILSTWHVQSLQIHYEPKSLTHFTISILNFCLVMYVQLRIIQFSFLLHLFFFCHCQHVSTSHYCSLFYDDYNNSTFSILQGPRILNPTSRQMLYFGNNIFKLKTLVLLSIKTLM
jgi:hypothetical protein